MKQLTSSVYAEDQFSIPPKYRGCNPSFVITSEGIVMIDTPMMPTDALKWRQEIAQRGEVRYIINTDYHPDHITGNSFFPGTVVSHEIVRDYFTAPAGQKMLKPGQRKMEFLFERVGEYDPKGVALLKKDYQPKPPTVTFSDRLTLYAGSHIFELIYLPGHTQGHIGVYLPQEKVFFSGDNFTNQTQPSMAQSLPLDWVKSLKKIEALQIDIIVPGHGVVGTKDDVRQFRLFLQRCIDIVRDAIKKGMTKEEAAARLSFIDLHPGRNQPVHPEVEQQHRNVLRLYEMLSKGS
ncbi:MBL fold metallo-hydrolase [Chloroflexota bacterium]